MSDQKTATDLLEERLEFVGMTEGQRKDLAAIAPIINSSLDGALNAFYAKAAHHPDTARFFTSAAHVDHAKSRQIRHWEVISSAKFDAGYVEAVSAVGRVHARLGLEPRWYIGGYALVLESILRNLISKELPGRFLQRRSKKLGDAVSAVVKAALVDMDYAISVYLDVLSDERKRAESERRVLLEQQEVALAAFDSALEALANSDLTSSVRDGLAANFDRLKENYNASIAGLDETISGIARAAGHVLSQAREISRATDDMARRTERQASALEETAAAIEQITTLSRQAESRTSEIMRMASDSSSEASKSVDIVHSTVEAMNEIDASSKKMSQMIGVIDEIAFQTNLLALNAGVEAARAGEQGRGFAVVAQEVRELAQRSAAAAKEVKTLIGISSADVARGVALVNETGSALESIGERVRLIDASMTTIVQSAREQAIGIGEINTAVGQLDLITQQNAAMVEQSAAATESLSAEAANLDRLVGGFNLRQDLGNQVRKARSVAA